MPLRRLIAVLILSLFVATGAARADNVSPEALRFAKVMSDKLLQEKLQESLKSTSILQGLAASKGIAALKPIYREEVDASVAKYGFDWQVRLANAYQGLLTPQEMKALTDQRADKATVEKLVQVNDEASARMETSVQDLMKKMTDDTLTRIYTRASQLPDASSQPQPEQPGQ